MVTDKQKRSLDYFRNKIVTIFTSPINRNFTEQDVLEYFVGKITNIDDNGIWYEHVKTKCLNFIFFDKITSISEEKFVPADEIQQITEEEKVENEVEVADNGEIKINNPKTLEDLKSLLGI